MKSLFEVVDDGAIIRVEVNSRRMTNRIAHDLCADIARAAAQRPSRPALLMNLSTLSNATPRAGVYAMRRIKRLNPSAIALYRGNRFMRGFASSVLRFARFEAFALFDDELSARTWLADRVAAGTTTP